MTGKHHKTITSQFATDMMHDVHRELDTSNPSAIVRSQTHFRLYTKNICQNKTVKLFNTHKYQLTQMTMDILLWHKWYLKSFGILKLSSCLTDLMKTFSMQHIKKFTIIN